MKKKFKINLANYLKYSFSLSIIIIIIILSAFVSFLYKNVYQTIAEAQELTSLRQNVISEKLEKTKFYEIISNMEKKIIPADYVSTTTNIATSTASTSTTSTTLPKIPTSTNITSTATTSNKIASSTKTISTYPTSTPKK